MSEPSSNRDASSDRSKVQPVKGLKSHLDSPIDGRLAFWVDPDGERWGVEVQWAEVDGRLEPVGLRIRHMSDSVRLKTTTLRAFNLSRTAEQMRRARIEEAPELAEMWAADGRDDYAQAVRDRATSSGVKRTRYDDEWYQEVARIYRVAFEEGLAPTRTVQETLGATTRRQAGRWVQQARAKGYLPPTEERKPNA